MFYVKLVQLLLACLLLDFILPAQSDFGKASSGSRQTDSRFNSQISDDIANGISNMGFRLLSEIGTSRKKTELMSPLCIANAISMVELGARGNTFLELANLLGFSSSRLTNKPSWQIHEQLGLLLEDLSNELPNPARARPKESWKIKKEIIEIENRFNFPTESSEEEVSTYRTRPKTTATRRTTTTTTTETPPSSTSTTTPSPDVVIRAPPEPENLQRPVSPFEESMSPSVKNQISVANAVFLQTGYSIRPDYKSSVQLTYKSDVTSLDMLGKSKETAKYISDWVEERTRGKITDFIEEGSVQDSQIIIVSALYFKAEWLDPFGFTMKKAFYPDGLDGPSVMTDIMYHDNIFPYYDAREYDCRMLGIPYKNSETTMYIILPNNSNRKRVAETQSLLTAERINEMIQKMEIKHTSVFFPKLNLKTDYGLQSLVQRLGVHSLFASRESDLSLISGGYQKNRAPASPSSATENKLVFSRLTNSSDLSQSLKNLDSQRQNTEFVNPRLYASTIIHKVNLVVDEVGTEGAAATGITIDRIAASIRFHVTVPFLMLIRHDSTKLPLFYGAIYDPST